MKTLQECKDGFAKKQGYENWIHLMKAHNVRLLEFAFDSAAELYASQFREPSSPTVKESEPVEQEELWKEMQDLYRSVRDLHGIQYVTSALMRKYTITRKQ